MQLEEQNNPVINILKNTLSSNETDDAIDIPVSYDGAWHRRGRNSHFGVGIVISVDTGHVLDSYVVSNLCYICNLNTDTSTEHECQLKFTGSAQAIEVEAGRVIFKRSILNYKLRYTVVVSNGDTKTVVTLNSDTI